MLHILNLSNFVTLCEDYLQIKLDLDLFLELFYCNPSPSTPAAHSSNVEPSLCNAVKALFSPSQSCRVVSRTGKNPTSTARTRLLQTSPIFPDSLLTASK